MSMLTNMMGILVRVALGPQPYLLVTFENGFPFRRLLRLEGLRWRCSNPPPQGQIQSHSHFATDGQSVSMSWCQPDFFTV
jgi:hypothetical protein